MAGNPPIHRHTRESRAARALPMKDPEMTPGAKRVAMGGGSTASRLPGSSRFFGLVAPAAVMASLIGPCGGGGPSGGGPTTPPSASVPPPSGNNPTVTITAAGAVSPKNILQATITVLSGRLL
jgi:hypothetical protein